ncbi:MAG: hypothetical protein AAF468_20625 [Pseudomonadota bacterium]
MSYAYIERFYGVSPKPGSRVQHTVTKRFGTIKRANGDPHYVSVRFDGLNHNRPCHPMELDYSVEQTGEEVAQ